jgi:hypothetical protein
MRRPRSLPLIVRARRLRVAGLAETLRLKHELTMLMVGEGVPEVVDEDESKGVTLAIPYETIAEASREAHARLFLVNNCNDEREAA